MLIKLFIVDQSNGALFGKTMGAVCYLMKKRYREKNLLAIYFEAIALAQLDCCPEARLPVLYKLIRVHDTLTAYKFATTLNMDLSRLPREIREGLIKGVPDSQHEPSDKFLELSDFPISATFIDTPELLIETCNSNEKVTQPDN